VLLRSQITAVRVAVANRAVLARAPEANRRRSWLLVFSTADSWRRRKKDRLLGMPTLSENM